MMSEKFRYLNLTVGTKVLVYSPGYNGEPAVFREFNESGNAVVDFEVLREGELGKYSGTVVYPLHLKRVY